MWYCLWSDLWLLRCQTDRHTQQLPYVVVLVGVIRYAGGLVVRNLSLHLLLTLTRLTRATPK